MKKLEKSMYCLLLALFTLSGLSAQNVWVGGAPGAETEWNVAKNWSLNKIPDWTQDVIIPDVSTQSGYFPIITSTIEAIPHIEIQANAILVILEDGKLRIDGSPTINSGILLVGDIFAKGDVSIINTVLYPIEEAGGRAYLEKELYARQ